MVTKIPGGLSSDEFDALIDRLIEQKDPHALSLDVLAERNVRIEFPSASATEKPRRIMQQSAMKSAGDIAG